MRGYSIGVNGGVLSGGACQSLQIRDGIKESNRKDNVGGNGVEDGRGHGGGKWCKGAGCGSW